VRGVAAVAGLMFALVMSAARVEATPAAAPAKRDSSSCVVCHLDQDEKSVRKPAQEWAKDVHAAAGLGCESCHGGNPARVRTADPDDAADAAMDPAKGFAPPPERTQIPVFCGRCHSDASYMKRYNPQARVDQLAEYRTSIHGMLNAKGDPVPATCVDCHGVHGIRPVSSPESPAYAANVPKTCARCHADSTRMAPYKIPTNQYDNYRRSVHATALLEQGDMAAPACNDCHGNHGAAPPEVKSVAHVCGHCHGREAVLFGASTHKGIFEEKKSPDCIVCHGNHRVGHPTPELFNGRSKPTITRGEIVNTDPFAADLGDLAPSGSATASWRVILTPHVPAQDFRYIHRVEIAAEGMAPIVLDATVRPGALSAPLPIRGESASGLSAMLEVEPLSGLPIESGDAVLLRATLEAGPNWPVRAVRIRDLPGLAVEPVTGAVCLRCHAVGDLCDLATDTMYTALTTLDRGLRGAASELRRAEVAGMEVSVAMFELKSKGTTAAVESRALIHSFDPQRLSKRAREGQEAADAGKQAAKAALVDLQIRRKGLAVSLVLIVLVLIGLYLKIREVDRCRREGALGGTSG